MIDPSPFSTLNESEKFIVIPFKSEAVLWWLWALNELKSDWVKNHEGIQWSGGHFVLLNQKCLALLSELKWVTDFLCTVQGSQLIIVTVSTLHYTVGNLGGSGGLNQDYRLRASFLLSLWRLKFFIFSPKILLEKLCSHCQDPCIKINECPLGSSQCTTQCKGVTRRRRDEESHNTMSFLQVTAFLFMVRILLLHFCPYCNIMSVHCKNPTGSLIINMYWNWQKKGRSYL